jgi:Tol biopolymer transport system component
VAYIGRQLINGGPGFNDCLVVAEVSPASGPPGALVNERCAINLTSTHAGESLGTTVSWAWDNLRLAYSSMWYTINPDLTKTPHGGLYVAEVPRDASSTPRDIRVQLSDGDPPLGRPTFSPVDYDDRVLFARQRDTSANARADIWVATVPASYDPLTTVAPTQITNGGNTQTTYQLQGIDWSPDGQWLAFTAHPLSSAQSFQIYKIRTDGSQKSVALTNSKKQGYGLTTWRR